jgi:hypothetical protein
VTGITVLNSMQNGIVTVGLPTIGRDLQLNPSLILWYSPLPYFSFAILSHPILLNPELS